MKINFDNRYTRLFVLWLCGVAILMIPLFYIGKTIDAPILGLLGFSALVSGIAVNWISWKIF
ncbi:TPA: hypothetical protein EYO12_02780 [Candidatus Saccharibacteria bacterium]|nr:hypothetical protein [Candidatus Saccharibacteria bacterium]HIO88036.1 hypothetical protein [Candidatus Saccharibacteria bacterium]